MDANQHKPGCIICTDPNQHKTGCIMCSDPNQHKTGCIMCNVLRCLQEGHSSRVYSVDLVDKSSEVFANCFTCRQRYSDCCTP